MSGFKTIEDIKNEAEELKESLWHYMDVNKKNHKGVKDSMNELLDLIDEIDEFGGTGKHST